MGKLRRVFSNFKADWNNHLVGFIATIFGILIAFQLQDWQDERNEREKLATGIASLKLEISENRELLKNGLQQLNLFNGYIGFIAKHQRSDSTLTCKKSEWDSIKLIYINNEDYSPDFTFSDNRVKVLNANTVEIKFDVPIKFFPPKIQTDSWEAIKSSGLLNSFPYGKLRVLTRLYGELNRTNTGTSPDDFMIYVRNEKFDVKEFYKLTMNIEFEYKVKTWRMDEAIEVIMKY